MNSVLILRPRLSRPSLRSGRPDLATARLRPSPAPTYNSPMRGSQAELTRPSGSNRSLCRALAMIAMAGIAVIAAACGGSSSSTSPAASASPSGPEKPDLVVAVVPAEAQAGLYIAQAKGLFTKAGLHVTIKPVVSALTVIPALLHGDVDIAGGQYPSYIATQAKGLAQMRILAAGFALGPRVNEILAPATGSAHGLADLKGKTIAVNILNSEGADLIYSSLKAHGITPAQVRLVAMPFPAMLPALAAGKIAAAYETEPFVTEAMKKYGDRELADMSSGPTTDMPLTGYGTLASCVAKYPRP